MIKTHSSAFLVVQVGVVGEGGGSQGTSSRRVEEGSQVEQNDILARLESKEYEAQVRRAQAQVQRAEADLAEHRRQFRVAENLARDQVLAQDPLEAAQSRVRIAEASVRQAEADLSWTQALLENTLIRAPFAGVVIKKMAEVGESVAPIPPGVNISTSSGAIVALADLETLEVEADVSESNVAKLQAEQPAEVTVEALMVFARKLIHERAAIPKTIEILAELPKTAVGKVFKPDLRRLAITRVYNEALKAADLPVQVEAVIEDKKRGLVAQITRADGVSDAAVTEVLGQFIRPWDWA